jgi:4-hydroxybutyrate CoA-transferase
MSWLEGYRAKLQTADDALRCVTSGMRVYIQPGCGEPEVLVRALLRRAPFLRNVEIVHLLTLGCADYVSADMAGHFRHNAFFIGGNVRDAVNDGRADYTPICLSEVEDLFESRAMPLDVALIQVSPPDAHGFCSFGVSVDTTLTASKCAPYVIAQINDQMPRTYGDSFIHVNQITSCVEASANLCELLSPMTTDIHVDIARNVAALIEDHSVLQTGIGGIPDAVLPFLMGRKDLGAHSELVSDSIIPLIEAGVLTGAKKKLQASQDYSGIRTGHQKALRVCR